MQHFLRSGPCMLGEHNSAAAV